MLSTDIVNYGSGREHLFNWHYLDYGIRYNKTLFMQHKRKTIAALFIMLALMETSIISRAFGFGSTSFLFTVFVLSFATLPLLALKFFGDKYLKNIEPCLYYKKQPKINFSLNDIQARVNLLVEKYPHVLSNDPVHCFTSICSQIASPIDLSLPYQVTQLFILSTMLANYFSCNLTTEVNRLYKSMEEDEKIDEEEEEAPKNKHILISKKILNDIRRLYVRWAQFFDTECRRLHLLEVTANIGRLIDFYCEKNLPGRFEGLPNIGELVALFQQELMEISLMNEMDLLVCCNEWMDKVSDERCQLFRAQNSYLTRKVDGPLSYTPSQTTSLKNFEVLKSQSNCLFAAASRIWGSPEWNADLSLEENALNLVKPLTRFMIVAQYEHLDGFVFEIPDPNNEYGSSPEQLGQTMKRVLTTLSDHDPANENSLRDDMNRPSWQFTFNYQRLFITSFAPCYPATSPRYAYGSSSVWILFQPEFSFSFHQIPAHEQKGGIRNKIRKNFEKHGRPFLLPHQGELMAHIYVKPINDLTDPRIDWFL